MSRDVRVSSGGRRYRVLHALLPATLKSESPENPAYKRPPPDPNPAANERHAKIMTLHYFGRKHPSEEYRRETFEQSEGRAHDKLARVRPPLGRKAKPRQLQEGIARTIRATLVGPARRRDVPLCRSWVYSVNRRRAGEQRLVWSRVRHLRQACQNFLLYRGPPREVDVRQFRYRGIGIGHKSKLT